MQSTAGTGKAFQRSQASHRLAQALRADLAAASRKQPTDLKSDLEYDAPAACKPEAMPSWLASEHVAFSLEEWATSHERGVSGAPPPMAPPNASRRDVLMFLCARRSGMANVVRMIMQWELTRPALEPPTIETARLACTLGVAEALKAAFAGM